MRAATVVQFKIYCKFYFTCDRSFNLQSTTCRSPHSPALSCRALAASQTDKVHALILYSSALCSTAHYVHGLSACHPRCGITCFFTSDNQNQFPHSDAIQRHTFPLSQSYLLASLLMRPDSVYIHVDFGAI